MKWGAAIQNAGNYILGGDETGIKGGCGGDIFSQNSTTMHENDVIQKRKCAAH
jgi:hypothetical protein